MKKAVMASNALVGNAQILFPRISYSPSRSPEACECNRSPEAWGASASGFFFGFWFCAPVFILVLRIVELTIDKFLESGDCSKVSGSAELAPQANFGQSLIFEAMCKNEFLWSGSRRQREGT